MPLVSEIQRNLSSISSNSENGQLITDEVYTMALKICFTDKSVHLFTAQRSWAYMKSEPPGRVPPPPPYIHKCRKQFVANAHGRVVCKYLLTTFTSISFLFLL